MLKRVVAILSSVCMCASCLGATYDGIGVKLSSSMVAQAQESTQKCGQNAWWSIDGKTETLTISGTGAIDDFGNRNKELGTPWGYQGFKKVIIENGITSIGNLCFFGCYELESVSIPDSVTSIGEMAFSMCDELREVQIPSSVNSIGYGAFNLCISLTSIVVPESVSSLEDCTFFGCKNLQSITIENKNCKIFDGKNTISDVATIWCHEDSTASKYAVKYKRSYKLIHASDNNAVHFVHGGSSFTIIVYN